MAIPELGRLEPVAVRDYWKDEARDFTPWLAGQENLELLAATLRLSFALESIEQTVGPYSADIVGRTPDDHRVVIENQFEKTDHDHLGKLLTYAAGLDDVRYVIWLAELFTEQHRAALDWLNRVTDDSAHFFGVQIELWRIGDSLAAPRFNLIVRPNDWVEAIRTSTDRGTLSETQELRLRFWQGFHRYLADAGITTRVSSPRPDSWVTTAVGRSNFWIALVSSSYDLDRQIWVKEAVTRVEFGIGGPSANEYFTQLQQHRGDIEEQIGHRVTWYAQAQIERKVFIQKLWEEATEAQWPAQYAWLAEWMERFREVFIRRIAALEVPDLPGVGDEPSEPPVP